MINWLKCIIYLLKWNFLNVYILNYENEIIIKNLNEIINYVKKTNYLATWKLNK